MGRAKIISGGPAGKYNIELVKDLAPITAELAAIDARLAELSSAIDAALSRKNAAGADLDEKTAAMNAAVAEYISDASKIEQVRAAQSACLAAQAVYRDAVGAHSLLLQEKESKTERKKILQAASVTENRLGVWCADLTEDLPAGREVSTIEVNGEYRISPIIYPAGATDKLALSKLQPVQASTPSGVFINQALFPYWQRWKPTYRIGTITSISGDSCDLTMDNNKSSHRKLALNPSPETLSAVPIEYMEGVNGDVFTPDDRVVVEFTDRNWNKPKVIGFESHPRGLGYISMLAVFRVDFNAYPSPRERIELYSIDENGALVNRKTFNLGDDLGYHYSMSWCISKQCLVVSAVRQPYLPDQHRVIGIVEITLDGYVNYSFHEFESPYYIEEESGQTYVRGSMDMPIFALQNAYDITMTPQRKIIKASDNLFHMMRSSGLSINPLEPPYYNMIVFNQDMTENYRRDGILGTRCRTKEGAYIYYVDTGRTIATAKTCHHIVAGKRHPATIYPATPACQDFMWTYGYQHLYSRWNRLELRRTTIPLSDLIPGADINIESYPYEKLYITNNAYNYGGIAYLSEHDIYFMAKQEVVEPAGFLTKTTILRCDNTGLPVGIEFFDEFNYYYRLSTMCEVLVTMDNAKEYGWLA